MILDLICAILLGIVEGITEWLPISSTAHLILATSLIEPYLDSNTIFTYEFKMMFDVVIQLGAIIGVVIIYFKKLYPFEYNDKEYSKSDKINIWIKIIISCIPIVVLGLLLDSVVEENFYNLFTIAIALIFYGVLFIIVEQYNKKRLNEIQNITDIGIKKALAVGFIQVLSIIPGTSRSGLTIVFGRMIGFSKVTATEYSFFLSIPIMFGASIYKMFKYLLIYKLTVSQLIILLIGMIVALIVSLIVIKKLIEFIKKYSFKIFGIYRIILGIFLLIIFFT